MPSFNRCTPSAAAALVVLAAVLGLAPAGPAEAESVRPGTKPARSVHESGFLGADAALLQKGGTGEAPLVYKNPDAAWPTYTKLLLDPVTLWRPPGEKMKVSAADAQMLINYFEGLIRAKLATEVELTDQPGPHTMRVKVAIVKLSHSHAALDMISTVVPQARGLSALKTLVTGKPAFVGEIAIETKITDAETGKLLAAAVADRVGNKTLDAEHLKSWGDVEEAMQFWVEHAAYNLCVLQKKPDCVKPKRDSLVP